jgi:hypothetical protein
MLEAGRSRIRFPMKSLDYSILLMLPALGSTKPLTEMSTRIFPGGMRRPMHMAENLCLEKFVTSTSHKRLGLHSLLQV